MGFLISLLNFLQSHWLILAFLAPMFWALVNIIDVYFVGKVYRDALDGTIIAGLFHILPWLALIFFLKINTSQLINMNQTLLIALLGGVLNISAFYFYFKTLFNRNDVALLQIIWGLTVVAVPVLSFLFWGEILPFYKYLGMGVVLLGATMLSMSKGLRSKISRRYLGTMLGAVVFLSLSMVFQDRAYSDLAAKGLGNQGFLLGFLFFSLGAFLTGLFFAIVNQRNPWPLIKKYFKIFLVLEGAAFLGNFASQGAISVAPSVSFVAAVETFVPVFVLLFSLLIIFFAPSLKKIYQEQIGGIWVKIIATVVMVVGVYLIS
ncbi:MAG: DMT family transporter [Patescibacteria group bacterium]|mgnify:FL=1